MSKKVKEKPSYSVWQNVRYIVGNLAKTDQKLMAYLVVSVVSAVVASVAELFLPKTVVQMVESQVPLKTLGLTILAFSAVIGLTRGLKVLLENMRAIPQINQRIGYITQVSMHYCTTDFSNLGRESYQKAMENAFYPLAGNRSAGEAIFELLQNLSISILCFIIYLALLTVIHPGILLLVFATSVTAFFLRMRVNNWEHDNDKKWTQPIERLVFVQKASAETKYAKDVRLFGLANWLDDIWDANKRIVDDITRQVSRRHLAVDCLDCAAAFLRGRRCLRLPDLHGAVQGSKR